MPIRAGSTSGRCARTVCALAAAYASADSGWTRTGCPTGPRYGSVRGLFVAVRSMCALGFRIEQLRADVAMKSDERQA